MIRKFVDDDFKEVCNLLIASHIHDELTESLVREKLYDDPDRDTENYLVYQDEDKISGFLQGVIREVRGEKIAYIKLMAVDEKCRRRKIATSLLSVFEKNLNQIGINKLRIYDVPLNYFMPGIDPRYTPAICFAQKNGFMHISDSINMDVELNQDFKVNHEIETVQKQGIEIRRATIDDKENLLEFISDPWALWKNEIEMAFKSSPISVYIALKDGKIKAFSAFEGNNKGTGWFGPMGTHPDLRGMGIGTILLKLCLDDMKKSGFKKSIIPWVGPVSFYSHYVNAYITRVFWRFEKQLN